MLAGGSELLRKNNFPVLLFSPQVPTLTLERIPFSAVRGP
jgi:hypothetical protein